VVERWLREQSLPVSAPLGHFLTAVTLLDQYILEEFNWRTFWVIIQNTETFRLRGQIVHSDALPWLVDLIDRRDAQNAFPRMLMDSARAGSLWVRPQMYTKLANKILKILRDK